MLRRLNEKNAPRTQNHENGRLSVHPPHGDSDGSERLRCACLTALEPGRETAPFRDWLVRHAAFRLDGFFSNVMATVYHKGAFHVHQCGKYRRHSRRNQADTAGQAASAHHSPRKPVKIGWQSPCQTADSDALGIGLAFAWPVSCCWKESWRRLRVFLRRSYSRNGSSHSICCPKRRTRPASQLFFIIPH